MKQVQYVGEEEINLCRFGVINKGAKVDFFEWEYEAIKDDPNYKYVGPVFSKEERAIAERVKPLGSKFFDLRTIPWENTNLYRLLTTRMSKQSLIKVIKAVNDVGGHIPDSSSGENRNSLIDKILSASSFMGWDKLTKEDRLSLPVKGAEPIADGEASKAARPRTRKSTELETNDINI